MLSLVRVILVTAIVVVACVSILASHQLTLKHQEELFPQSYRIIDTDRSGASRSGQVFSNNLDANDEGRYFSTITDWPFPLPQVDADPNKNKTHWCIIGKHASSKPARRFFYHFPHAAESILPCWSWFRAAEATDRCGFIFLDEMRLNYSGSFHCKTCSPNPWMYQLVHHAMRCQVRTVKEFKANLTNPLKDDPEAIYHTPSLYWKNPRYGRINYIANGPDAWALRRRLVSDEWIVQQKQPPESLQIGIIQRTSSRVLLQIDEIVALLQSHLPTATITTTYLPTTLLVEQAQWFATKDIIIAAHGAALMNSLFILPKTVVMQVYPPSYFYQSLEPLIETVGGIALDCCYNMSHDPIMEWQTAVEAGESNKRREENITLSTPQEVVDPILFVIHKLPTPSGWFNLRDDLNTTWIKRLEWMGNDKVEDPKKANSRKRRREHYRLSSLLRSNTDG